MLAIKLSNNFNNFKNCSGTAQKVGLAILNLRYRYVVQVCGTGIWYVVQPYQACGTGMWYRYVAQVCGTGMWYKYVVQVFGTGIWYSLIRYVVQVCGTSIWYKYVVQPYQVCGTGMWYRYVVQVCGTGIWYSLIRYVVQVCGTALSGKIWAQLKFQTQQDHHNLDAVCLHVRVLPMSASPCNRSI